MDPAICGGEYTKVVLVERGQVLSWDFVSGKSNKLVVIHHFYSRTTLEETRVTRKDIANVTNELLRAKSKNTLLLQLAVSPRKDALVIRSANDL